MCSSSSRVRWRCFYGLGGYLQSQMGGVLMSWGQNGVCGMAVVFLGFWLMQRSKRGGQVVWDGGRNRGDALNA